MSFQLYQLESGIKVTTRLRHLGFWLKDSLVQALSAVSGQNQNVYLDLGPVSYVDETIASLLREARAQFPNLQLVGFPRNFHPAPRRTESTSSYSVETLSSAVAV